MEEKNLVTLPDKVADYIEYMKGNNYTLKGALNVILDIGEPKKIIENYLEYSTNQEKFALAWVNGYKREEKFYIVKFKNFDNVYSYLNYEKETKIFKLSSEDESKYFQTKFTKEFLKENSFGWVIDCEGVELFEVK